MYSETTAGTVDHGLRHPLTDDIIVAEREREREREMVPRTIIIYSSCQALALNLRTPLPPPPHHQQQHLSRSPTTKFTRLLNESQQGEYTRRKPVLTHAISDNYTDDFGEFVEK